MAKIRIDQASITKMNGELNGFLTRKKFQWKRTVKNVAEEIMAESVAEVPVDTGALASTAYVDEQATSDGIAFGYAGPRDRIHSKSGLLVSEYMTAVHEDLTAKHTNGKAKFLEDPIRRKVANLEEIIAAGMKE